MIVSLSEVFGVGKKTLEIFHNYNIFTTQDLIEYFPKKYISFEETSLLLAVDNTDVTVIGEVVSLPVVVKHRGSLDSLRFKILVDSETYNVIAYRRGYLKESIAEGQVIQIKGRFKKKQKEITASNILLKPITKDFKPAYLIEGIYDVNISKIIVEIYKNKLYEVKENLPKELVLKRNLLTRQEMIHTLHFPKSKEVLDKAFYRLKYEEAFFLQKDIFAHYNEEQKLVKEVRNYQIDDVKKVIEEIPFKLTNDQKESVNDLFRDFKSKTIKKRLIQGDVGSGKTVVVGIAIYGMKTAGFQSAFMAPTEILALQHYQTFTTYFPSLKVALLTGSTTKKAKLKEEIFKGDIDLVVGTHALITDDMVFNNLGFVVIDEQHRFGVMARETLETKGVSDICYLTATPIPRTLATVILGDMEISNIREKPAGRKEIETYYFNQSEQDSVFKHMQKELQKGNNVYVVMPSIESEIRGENVYSMYEKLASMFYEKVYMLHGKMTSAEKEKTMQEFTNDKGAILVSTTVVEVGVDVKHATMMVIFNGEYFGLSQLHQLRGRVGRSDLKSYCYVLSDDSDIERLNIFKNTNDGFLLSEYDLENRGPGEFLGLKQSGMINFNYADLTKDFNIFLQAKEDLLSIIKNNKMWNLWYYTFTI